MKINENFIKFCLEKEFNSNESESFQTNPKNVSYLIGWKRLKNKSELIRFISLQSEESEI